jgi:benzoyl-CoA reductase/2-hydroxyglutaryl-CoA dehydratase subunit BcrC/BadD/HgdB
VFVQLAGELAGALRNREVSAGAVRLVVAGNCPDTTALHASLEAAGGVVVGDYHDRGEPTIGPAFDQSLPPLRAISEHYQRRIPGARTFPSDAGAIVHFAQDAAAQGVVFFYFRQEEVLTWDYPQQRRALAAAGIASCCLAAQSYCVDGEAVQQAVRPFLAGLGDIKRAS